MSSDRITLSRDQVDSLKRLCDAFSAQVSVCALASGSFGLGWIRADFNVGDGTIVVKIADTGYVSSKVDDYHGPG